jgi:hypothetical protein
MKFTVPINLGPSWAQIQELVLPFCQEVGIDMTSGKGLGETEKQSIKALLKTSRSIAWAILFIQGPRHTQKLHVDGFSTNRKGSRNWALNIPIKNTLDSEQIWYDGRYTLDLKDSLGALKYLDLIWSTEKEEVHREVIAQPTIVRINSPHHVINYSDQSRFMLSVRFDPDLDGDLPIDL